ncbi:MAG: carboxylate-amine ligase [Actinomycetota bacterium]|nr:carboxylate-amine ligase [Actinomycetota bacterium]
MSTPAFTVGVEEEFHVVDAESLALRSAVRSVLGPARLALGDQVAAELLDAQIEAETQVCETLEEVRSELTRLRHGLAGAAEAGGARIMASGTHPFSTWQEQGVTPRARYQQLADDYRQLAREQLVCACHVHVGVPDPDEAVRIMDRTRPWLAVLLALCANSPYWEGEDTGYAGFRTAVFDRWPTTGTPLPLGSRPAFDAVLADLLATGVIRDAGALYWDVRPSARYPTLEFRVADVCPSVDEAVMLAGLVRSLVRTIQGRLGRDEPFDHPRPEVARAARWQASRHGLDGDLVDLAGSRPVPAAEVVERLLDLLRDDLEGHGEWDEVASLVRRQLAQGSGARRQRAAAERGGIKAVAEHLVAETAKEHLVG